MVRLETLPAGQRPKIALRPPDKKSPGAVVVLGQWHNLVRQGCGICSPFSSSLRACLDSPLPGGRARGLSAAFGDLVVTSLTRPYAQCINKNRFGSLRRKIAHGIAEALFAATLAQFKRGDEHCLPRAVR
jgi:hypothetical protein